MSQVKTIVENIPVLDDGTEVTVTEITKAFESGNAVLVHCHGEQGRITRLMLDGIHHDHRCKCTLQFPLNSPDEKPFYSPRFETWTSKS